MQNNVKTTLESVKIISGLVQKAQITASESAKREYLRDAIGMLGQLLADLEKNAE